MSPPASTCSRNKYIVGSVKASTSERALGVHVEGIDRRARGHKEPVAIGAAEAEVCAALGQIDAADELAIRVEDRHAIEPFLAHAPAAPEVAVHVAAIPVRCAGAGVEELALVAELGAAVNHVVHLDDARRDA